MNKNEQKVEIEMNKNEQKVEKEMNKNVERKNYSMKSCDVVQIFSYKTF